MSEHPKLVAQMLAQAAEVEALVRAFGEKHAQMTTVEDKLRDVKAEHAHKKTFRETLLEMVKRHGAANTELALKLTPPAKPATDDDEAGRDDERRPQNGTAEAES